MMTTVTRERVLERVAELGPLQNVFLVAGIDDTFALPMIWHPEIGLRYLVIEDDGLAQAVYEYLRYEAKVRRFESERQVSDAMYEERWQGWDTCADYRRMQQAIEEMSRTRKK
jgi:hypothetical protein